MYDTPIIYHLIEYAPIIIIGNFFGGVGLGWFIGWLDDKLGGRP